MGLVRFFWSARNGYSMASLLSRHGGSTALTVKISSWTTSPIPQIVPVHAIPRERNRRLACFFLWKASWYRVQPDSWYRVQFLVVSRAEVLNSPVNSIWPEVTKRSDLTHKRTNHELRPPYE